MFKKREELDYSNVDTILGKDTEFSGSISGKGILRIDGKISGEIVQNGDIIVGDNGFVDASIKARHITVSGTVHGNIEASGLLKLLSSAKVFGDIKVLNLSIADGAIYKGSCEMTRSSDEKSTKKQNEYKKQND